MDGLLLATMLSGAMTDRGRLPAAGARISSTSRIPVTVGFTGRHRGDHLASQIKELLGLTLRAASPRPLVPKLSRWATRSGAQSGGRRCRCWRTRDLLILRASAALAGHVDRGRALGAALRRRSICRLRPSARRSAASRARCRSPAYRRSRWRRCGRCCRRRFRFALLGAMESCSPPSSPTA